jgi:hypothetical protein
MRYWRHDLGGGALTANPHSSLLLPSFMHWHSNKFMLYLSANDFTTRATLIYRTKGIRRSGNKFQILNDHICMHRMEHRTLAYMSPRPLVLVDNEFVSCLKVVPLNKLT